MSHEGKNRLRDGGNGFRTNINKVKIKRKSNLKSNKYSMRSKIKTKKVCKE
jgi:hypothetical protein